MVDVELRAISKSFGATQAVCEASFTINEGEFLTLLGPSGCGKTTTLRLIAGLETPDAGEIYVREQRVDHLPPFRRDTPLVFQNYALFPHKTVYDNVAFGLKYRGVPRDRHRARVSEALEIVRLPGYEARYPAQLSGGQQQRVALARALVLHPAVLLLDEPLSNLDKNLREQMRLEIKQIQERVGITFVMVTHDQEEAIAMSDRMVVMSAGRVLQVGPPQDIYYQPGNQFVAEFMGRSNFLEAVVTHVDGEMCRVRTSTDLDLQVRSRPGLAAGSNVVVQMRAEHLQLHRDRPGNGNSLPGRVLRRIFLGNRTEYRITLTTGEELVVVGTAGSPLMPDDAVWVAAKPADCVVLPAGAIAV